MRNKLCALVRDEAKDISDLIFLSMKYDFTWETMINYARQKYRCVNEIEVSQSVYQFDTRKLIKIKWIKEPNYETMRDVCKIIAKDIIISLGGMTIGNMQDYMNALRSLKKGDTTEAVVRRGDQVLTLKVQF